MDLEPNSPQVFVNDCNNEEESPPFPPLDSLPQVPSPLPSPASPVMASHILKSVRLEKLVLLPSVVMISWAAWHSSSSFFPSYGALPLLLFLVTTIYLLSVSRFASSFNLFSAPLSQRLTKADKKAIKYANAKKRLKHTRQKYHRKKSQIYKELTEEERAIVKAGIVAREEERAARFAAVLAVDAPWLRAREKGSSPRQGGSLPFPKNPAMGSPWEADQNEEADRRQEASLAAPLPSFPPSLPRHLRIALDLHYGERIHGIRGTRSLTQQVGWCYHALKRASSFDNTPIFHVTSFQGPTAEVLRGSGVHNWPIYRHAASVVEVFPRPSIVYLTPDADQVLAAPLDLSKGELVPWEG